MLTGTAEAKKETVDAGGKHEEQSGPPSETKTLPRSKKWVRTGTHRRFLIAGENPLRRKNSAAGAPSNPHLNTQTLPREGGFERA